VRYFTTLPKGVASHTVLVQDIPGVPFGTQQQRVESVAPKFIASKARRALYFAELLGPINHMIIDPRLRSLTCDSFASFMSPLVQISGLGTTHTVVRSGASGSSTHGKHQLKLLAVWGQQVHAGVAKSASLAEKGVNTTTDKALRCSAPLPTAAQDTRRRARVCGC
jgi:hypothetical protein